MTRPAPTTPSAAPITVPNPSPPSERSTPRRHRGEPQWQPRRQPQGQPLPEAYLTRAEDYRRRSELFPGWREQLVSRLAPHRGDTVIDIGCGPGLNFAALQAAVGPHGTIIGIDSSPELLTVAATRVTRRRWDNVELINAPAATVSLSMRADAALFAAANDVLTSTAAVSNIVAHLQPGARVAAGGWKWPAPWLWPLKVCLAAWQRPCAGDFTDFGQPWRLLSDHVTDLQIREIGFGAGYLTHATTKPRPGTHTDAGDSNA